MVSHLETGSDSRIGSDRESGRDTTYAKGLARRASLTEGSARAAKSYKAKVASLTSERAGLQA